MQKRSFGFMIPEFPQQTHIAWWRVSEGMRLAGVDVHLLSTRRPTQDCPHPQLREAAARNVSVAAQCARPAGFARVCSPPARGRALSCVAAGGPRRARTRQARAQEEAVAGAEAARQQKIAELEARVLPLANDPQFWSVSSSSQPSKASSTNAQAPCRSS